MPGTLKIEVLGCWGGELPGYRSPCLLLNDTILLDAGSFSGQLSLRRQLALEHVLLSHSHFDHVKDLPAFADLIIGRRNRPVVVHASPEAMDCLRRHLFNNQLWPDFFSLPSPGRPTLRAQVFQPRRWFRLGGLRIKAIPVSHPVECMSFIVRSKSGSFFYTGDTGPVRGLWRELRRVKDLKLLLVETKFPSRLQLVADAAGHFTPTTIKRELEQLGRPGLPIRLYHLKPEFHREIWQEVKSWRVPSVRLLRQGEIFLV